MLTADPFQNPLQQEVWSFLSDLYELANIAGEGNGTPLQCSCLENPMDRGAWWAAVHGVSKSRTRLSNFTFTFHFRALEKDMAPHSSVLPGDSQGRGAWRAAICGVAQSRTRLRRLSSSSRYSTAIMTENTLSELWSQQQPLS